MGTAVILLVAAFFLMMGLLGLAAPTALVRPFRIVLEGPEARTEIRAVYGGFGVAMAAVLVLAVLDGAGTGTGTGRGAVLAVAGALGGMAFGRLAARAADRPSAFYPIWFYFWVEVVAAVALAAAA
ncbi:DUF4345 family protein [Spirillospora sp. CA-255316]